jgi:hypothetical protein
LAVVFIGQSFKSRNKFWHKCVGLHFGQVFRNHVFKSYTLAGFDLTTHSSSLLGGRRRRCH